VTLDGFELSPELRSQAERETELRLRSLPPTASAAVLVGGHVYSSRSCASRPEVGCARLRWSHAPLEDVSILAARLRSRLQPWPSAQGDGYDIGILSFGHVTPQAMLASARSSQTIWTWLKRGSGFLLIWTGWGLLLGPASYIASWVPLLGQLVGCVLGLVAFGAAVAHALTVIAVAWFAHRPVLAITLLAIAGGFVFVGVSGLRSYSAKSSAHRK